MGLIGLLSNQKTTALYQCLMSRGWRKPARPRPPEHTGPQPDGRRSFGSVSRTIIQVLAQAGAELRVSEIHRRVEEELGGSGRRFIDQDVPPPGLPPESTGLHVLR